MLFFVGGYIGGPFPLWTDLP